MEVDDIVEVLSYRLDSGLIREVWTPAVVIHVEPHKIEVRALKGTFDGEHKLKALPTSEKGRTWK